MERRNDNGQEELSVGCLLSVMCRSYSGGKRVMQISIRPMNAGRSGAASRRERREQYSRTSASSKFEAARQVPIDALERAWRSAAERAFKRTAAEVPKPARRPAPADQGECGFVIDPSPIESCTRAVCTTRPGFEIQGRRRWSSLEASSSTRPTCRRGPRSTRREAHHR